MRICWSYFPSIRATTPTPIELSWSQACDFLRLWSEVPRTAEDKEAGAVDALSPAEFIPGTTRRKDAVLRWHWAAFDVDNDNPGRNWDFWEVRDLLGNLSHCLHTTTKSRPEHHRFRVILPLSRPVEMHEFPAFWSAADTLLGGMSDHKTRNPDRVFYVPARWTGANNLFTCRTDGPPLDVDGLLALYPAPAPAPVVNPPPPAQPAPRLITTLVDPAALVTEEMRQDYLSALPGTGRFFRFMCRVASRAAFLGHPITPHELERLGLDMDRATGHPKRRPGSLREAMRALDFASTQCLQPPLNRAHQSRLDRILRLQARAGR